MRMSNSNGEKDGCKVYVGDLGNHATDTELELAFKKFGKLKSVFVAKRPPGFAFVEFEDRRDAEDAANELDGRVVCGRRVRVEVSHGKSRWPGGRPPTYLMRRPAPRYVRSPPRRSSPSYRLRRSQSRSRSRSRSPPDRRRKGRRTPSYSRSRSKDRRSSSHSKNKRHSQRSSRSREISRNGKVEESSPNANKK